MPASTSDIMGSPNKEVRHLCVVTLSGFLHLFGTYFFGAFHLYRRFPFTLLLISVFSGLSSAAVTRGKPDYLST